MASVISNGSDDWTAATDSTQYNITQLNISLLLNDIKHVNRSESIFTNRMRQGNLETIGQMIAGLSLKTRETLSEKQHQ